MHQLGNWPQPKKEDLFLKPSKTIKRGFTSVIVLFDEHSGDKDVYIRQSKNDILDIKKIAGGLCTLGLNLRALPILHVITGCDQSSYNYGIGKPTA